MGPLDALESAVASDTHVPICLCRYLNSTDVEDVSGYATITDIEYGAHRRQ